MGKFQPEGWRTVTPRIITRDVEGLVDFLKAVFDAEGEVHAGRPAEIMIGDSLIMVSDGGGMREMWPAFLYVYVEAVDETYRRAIHSGAQSIEEPIDTPYGDRRATLRDPWGNMWQVAARQAFEPRQ